MAELVKELRQKRVELTEKARAIQKKADEEKRTLTAEERAEFDKHFEEVDKLKAQVDSIEGDERRRSKLDDETKDLERSAGRRSDPGEPIAPTSTPAEKRDQPIKLKLRGHEYTLAPGSSPHTRHLEDYAQRFNRYLSTGERRDLMVADNTKGGYLAGTTFAAQLIQAIDDEVFIRGLATVLPPLMSSVSLGAASLDADPADPDWTPEVPASALSADTTMAFGKRELTPHQDTKLIKPSMKLLRSSALPVESIILQRLAYKFAVAEEKAFLTGSGEQRPLGVFTASADGVPTTRDVTAAATTTFTADELIDTKFNVKSGYMRSGVWIMHRDAVKIARKLKDVNEQYLWQPGLQANVPDRILDSPYFMSEYAPNTFTAGLYVAVFGDFAKGYWIVDSLDLEIQRLDELFAATNQVGLLGRKETDGMPVLAEAFSRLKLAAS